MLNEELLAQVDKKRLSNIVAKVRDGKALTTQEQNFLDKQRDQGGGGSRLDETTTIKTSELVELFGVTAQQIANLARDQVLAKTARGKYKAWESIASYIRMLKKGRKSGHGSNASLEELRQRLIDEQGRKEAAMARLRELELKEREQNLIPEAEATQKLMKLLVPLRRLLDALPRQAAAAANPGKPAVAEKAIRQTLDERVFAEIEKILTQQDDD